jgi:putative transposase
MKKRKGKVGTSWRLDETYIKVKGIWCYLYRAVDKLGHTVDFLLTRKRQRMSAQSFLINTITINYQSILNYFDNRSTNASAESFNAKIKAFRAQFRGVRSIDFFLFRLSNLFA